MDFGKIRKWALILGMLGVLFLVGAIKHIAIWAGVIR